MRLIKILMTLLLTVIGLLSAAEKTTPEVANVALYYSNDFVGYLAPCG
jgi:hypothetical protein